MAALALAARELAREPLQEALDPQDAGGAADLLLHRRVGHPAQPQGEGEVVEHAHVRIERVVLEHHGDVAPAHRHVVDHLVADRDLAVGDLLQPRHHAQEGRLAAARGTDQGDELAVLDRQVDAVNHLHGTVGLANAPEIDRRHRPAAASTCRCPK